MSLIARHLEANDIATVCISSALDITEASLPPRSTFVDYPLGHTTGKPFDPEDQYAIVRASVEALETVNAAGEIVHLPNRWSEDESWRLEIDDQSAGDTRQPRDETPQFQTEDDRRLAIASGALRA